MYIIRGMWNTGHLHTDQSSWTLALFGKIELQVQTNYFNIYINKFNFVINYIIN